MKVKKRNILNLIIMLIVSILIFTGLVVMQKRIVSPNGTEKVYVVKKDASEGTLIENQTIFDQYFELKTIDKDKVIDGAVRENNKNDLINKIVVTKLYKNEVVSENRLIDKDDILAAMKEPRELSIKGSDISEVVGGNIREGDLIDIDVIDKVNGEAVIIKRNVYVNSVSTGDGQEVNRDTKGAAATNLNIIIEEKEQIDIKSKLALGNIKISKVIK